MTGPGVPPPGSDFPGEIRAERPGLDHRSYGQGRPVECRPGRLQRTWMASATTTEPAVAQRLSFTVFHPAEKLHVPSVFHWPPLSCWLTFTVASEVPLALAMRKGAAVERLVPAVH